MHSKEGLNTTQIKKLISKLEWSTRWPTLNGLLIVPSIVGCFVVLRALGSILFVTFFLEVFPYGQDWIFWASTILTLLSFGAFLLTWYVLDQVTEFEEQDRARKDSSRDEILLQAIDQVKTSNKDLQKSFYV